MGVESRFRSAWGTGINVADIASDPERVAQELTPVAKQIRIDDEPKRTDPSVHRSLNGGGPSRTIPDIPVIDPSWWH